MGARLEKLINERANDIVCLYEDYSEEIRKETLDALCAKWRSEIKQEVLEECCEEEIAQMKDAVDKARGEYTAQKAAEDLRSLIIEGIWLALIVGLLVNQATDIISYVKGEKAWTLTILLIVAFSLTLLVYVLTRLVSTIGKLLKK